MFKRRCMTVLGMVACLSVMGANANASDLESLAKRGYGALMETNVSGEFKGCEYNKRIPLQNGLIFVCQTYSYHYAYSPEVLILKSVRTGDIQVVIDGDQYDGQLYR